MKLLSGKDVFAVLPGFRKSLCYAVLPFTYDLHERNDSSITGVTVFTPSSDCNYERSGIHLGLLRRV